MAVQQMGSHNTALMLRAMSAMSTPAGYLPLAYTATLAYYLDNAFEEAGLILPVSSDWCCASLLSVVRGSKAAGGRQRSKWAVHLRRLGSPYRCAVAGAVPHLFWLCVAAKPQMGSRRAAGGQQCSRRAVHLKRLG